ncbi:hypothetical protein BDN72DRAFT_851393 [Pluteus cervinus]|uniref:Uncharacterized protein n=1 Tax=Pluteus cervinus TaxID=181527 RepID=A0ACD3A0J2_9AGAR|nr:hypothetical protein BDN72DRAFT_851393 [Pluteus cervinus]
MNAKDNATIHISHSTVYNTINHVTYGSKTKITSMMTSSRETRKEIPHVNPTDSLAEGARKVNHLLASRPISHREVESGVSFEESWNMLMANFKSDHRLVIWQMSRRISQMQLHSEFVSSAVGALAIAPHSRRIIPFLDWRLLQGPIGYRGQMEHYAKRDPLFKLDILQGFRDINRYMILLELNLVPFPLPVPTWL